MLYRASQTRDRVAGRMSTVGVHPIKFGLITTATRTHSYGHHGILFPLAGPPENEVRIQRHGTSILVDPHDVDAHGSNHRGLSLHGPPGFTAFWFAIIPLFRSCLSGPLCTTTVLYNACLFEGPVISPTMSFNTRESPTASARPDAPRQSPARRPSRKTSGVSLAPGMIPPPLLLHPSPQRGHPGVKKTAGLEPKQRAKVNRECLDSQEAQRMPKFYTDILALDPHARFSVDRDPLKPVIHSRCSRGIAPEVPGDTSNFKEHVSICQAIPPDAVTPVRPNQVPCPGFNFEELCGKAYRSLRSHERQQVTNARDAADLVWLEPGERKFVASKSCLKRSPSNQGPAQPCENCSKAVESSNVRETLSRITSNPKYEFFNQFRSINSTTVGSVGGHKVPDVSQPHHR